MNKDQFKLQEIPLRKSRPFIFRSVELLTSGVPPGQPAKLEMWLRKSIEDLLKQQDKDSAENMTDDMLKNPQDYPSLPMLRLRLEYTGGF